MAELSCLLHLLQDIPSYKRLAEGLARGENREYWLAVPQGAKAYLVAALYHTLGMPMLLVTAQVEEARKLYEELRIWSPSPDSLYLFPELDRISSEAGFSDYYKVVDRLRVLSALSLPFARPSNSCSLVVTSIQAVMSDTVSRDDLTSLSHSLEVGMTVDLEQLLKQWVSMGYEIESLVEIPGSVARRGGIIDVFSPACELPARIELFGNRIESIRYFDPKTQRSVGQVTSIVIVPAKEDALRSGSLLDYFKGKGLFILDEIGSIRSAVEKEVEQCGKTYSKVGVRGVEARLSASLEELGVKIRASGCCVFLNVGGGDGGDPEVMNFLPLSSLPSYGGKLQYFYDELRRLRTRVPVVVVSQQTERLAEFLQDEGIEAAIVSEITRVPSQGSVVLARGSLNAGWMLRDKLALFTDGEIFGFVRQQRSFKRRPVRYHWFTSELMPGDYVVHVEHGIGKFAGLTRMNAEGVEKEYLVLEYAAGDKLYVPVEQAERVSRYVGASEEEPALTRLGTQEWSQTKQRVKESVLNIARELLELYAKREVTPGFSFSADTLWQQELEASFPYVETPDQIEAVNAVKRDMEKPRPMDRLVCGDVGYGKTEVALRAAFKAVLDGKQVALLVPTTVLAQQHLNTFRQRLQAFPVRVEMLSRFCTEKEQARVLAGLAAGTVDICIGTHRLLQKDVVFKDLGLVIIDEEQRFGVVHKEYFKKLRQEVDVLTLSATPIPRTLHMALTGIRDMSIIETPPEERLPVKTHVGAYDARLVRMAILREMERGGQVFYVHNRIKNIYCLASELKELVPEARILVAHGRMPEDELEVVMSDFVARKADVLVTTTIIESGLDMPNVNTLIVVDADLLGLSQLYQLRGRVGRGCNNAYAYFFYDGNKELTPEAVKRLKTIAEATELGAGFVVAMRDLEIRGAGNLLGVEQSGYVAAVGFDLYCRMLAEAVEEIRASGAVSAKKTVEQPAVLRIDLPLSAYIPDEYISDMGTRLNFYRRMANLKQENEIIDIATELTDRFGAMPEPVKNLLYIIRLKQLGAKALVKSIFTAGKYIVVQFDKIGDLKSSEIEERFGREVKVGYEQIKIDTSISRDNWTGVLEEVLRYLARSEVV